MKKHKLINHRSMIWLNAWSPLSDILTFDMFLQLDSKLEHPIDFKLEEKIIEEMLEQE